jgi:RNA polymerase sigma-70 factor (ECF subfamily)
MEMMMTAPEDVQAGTAQRTTPSAWTSGWPQSPPEFEALIDVFQDRLVRYAFCRLRDVCDAEDVVQEVFLKAYTHRNKLHNVYPVAPYLYRMVANMCIDLLRQPRPVIVPIDEIRAEDTPHVHSVATERIAAAEQLKYADELLARLPRRQAEVLRLRVLDDLSLAEIAEMHGCSLATVKSRLRYGVARLRRILSRGKEGTP